MVFKRDEEIYEPEEPNWDAPGDSPSNWALITDEFYVRDASGKEIANYVTGELSFWNIYGSDNIGRINADTTKQFYLKDHLGTIRAVTNASNEIISSYDFDAWGYPLREWNLSDNSKYKFTGKERDIETNYDYFGARYYDARIGRWGGTDPLFEKHINFTPYNYVLNNQMILVDPDGKQINFIKFVYSSALEFTSSYNSREIRYEAEKKYRDNPERVAEFGPQPGNIDETIQPQDIVLFGGAIGKVGVKTIIEKGFFNFGKRAVNSLGEIFENPSLIKGMQIEEVEKLAMQETKYEIGTLTKGGKKGGSFKVTEKTANGYGDKMIMRHPGGGHHGSSPYWKVSSAKNGTVRLFDTGTNF